jgi:hypothetical protein
MRRSAAGSPLEATSTAALEIEVLRMTERTRNAQKIGRVVGRGVIATAPRTFAMVDSSVN